MTTWMTRIAIAVLALAPAARADDTAKTKHAGTGTGDAVSITPKDMKWGEAPPDLPRGAHLAVLHGDPTKAGNFTMRIKAPDGYKVPPHWHSQNEEITVVSGNLVLHMGDTMTSDPHELEGGSYHYLPAKMHHAAEAKGETVIQISGMGPFDIHYLNPADNPNPKSARR